MNYHSFLGRISAKLLNHMIPADPTCIRNAHSRSQTPASSPLKGRIVCVDEHVMRVFRRLGGVRRGHASSIFMTLRFSCFFGILLDSLFMLVVIMVCT